MPHTCKIPKSYLVPVPNYWTWTKTNPQKKIFWSNPYKIEFMMITSLIEMLQLRNWSHDDELFLQNGWPTKGVNALFPAETIQRFSPSQIPDTTNRVWTCVESDFRLCWMEFCSSDNHYTTAWSRDKILLETLWTEIITS